VMPFCVAHGQSGTYVNAVIHAGGIPLILPVTDDPEALRRLYDLIDGLFLAGGNDINPQLYGQQPYSETNDYSDLRDRTEKQLAGILQTESIGANAHHHQAVKDLGEGVIATAWAEDGVVEAIEPEDYPYMIGVQSHPESLEGRAEPRWR
jgi:gamma-glutamyl-gamma-aminobutyrate hydrolase PuuD